MKSDLFTCYVPSKSIEITLSKCYRHALSLLFRYSSFLFIAFWKCVSATSQSLYAHAYWCRDYLFRSLNWPQQQWHFGTQFPFQRMRYCLQVCSTIFYIADGLFLCNSTWPIALTNTSARPSDETKSGHAQTSHSLSVPFESTPYNVLTILSHMNKDYKYSYVPRTIKTKALNQCSYSRTMNH